MEEKDTKIEMSPPWVTYWRELQAMFDGDPDIRLNYNEDDNEVKIFENGEWAI